MLSTVLTSLVSPGPGRGDDLWIAGAFTWQRHLIDLHARRYVGQVVEPVVRRARFLLAQVEACRDDLHVEALEQHRPIRPNRGLGR